MAKTNDHAFGGFITVTNNFRNSNFSIAHGMSFCLLLVAMTIAAAAQVPNKQQHQMDLEDFSVRPIYVTARIFQMIAPKNSYQDLSDQIFKMSSDSLNTDEQWMKAFAKAFPGFKPGLLRTENKKVFRTSKPAIISLVKQSDGRDIEIQLFGAQSMGDGVAPGTTLISELSLHFPNAQTNKPISYAVSHIEVESGKTYFFAAKNLKMNPVDFVRFVRPSAQPEGFEGQDMFLALALSVDLEKSSEPTRFVDERQSLTLQNQATKKITPEVPASFREAGFGGNVRIRVEVSSQGKVTAANVYYSGFPEMNELALAAAREWEFPATLFETDKNPITCFITFSFPAQTPVKKASTGSAEK